MGLVIFGKHNQPDDEAEDQLQLDLFRSNPPHFLTVSAKENTTND